LTTKIHDYQDRLNEAHSKIEDAKQQLKVELFGIDDIIDDVCELTEGWMSFPEAQIRPTVVNLWGMTGTGKTSLVKSLAEILKVRLVHLDMGEFVDGTSMSYDFIEKFAFLSNQPCIILLDEIQNPRTINESQAELDRGELRALWSLLSTGKVYRDKSFDKYGTLFKLMNAILYRKMIAEVPLIQSEIDYIEMSRNFYRNEESIDYQARNDLIDKMHDSAASPIERAESNDNISWNNISSISFMQGDDKLIAICDNIIKSYRQMIAQGNYSLTGDISPKDTNDKWYLAEETTWRLGIHEVGNILDNPRDKADIAKVCALLGSGEDWLHGAYLLLESVYIAKSAQTELDFTKTLIFVTGNLDEIYTRAKQTNPDVTPDLLHQWSKRITVPDIKQALIRRFRPEQVARFGNNHILYPSPSGETFRKIIQKEFSRINAFMSEKFDVEFIFEQSVEDIIYNEGVFPTQGARSVISTVSSMIEPAVPKFALALLRLDNVDFSGTVTANITWDNDKQQLVFAVDNNVVFVSPVELKVESLRAPVYDERSIRTAIHEAGHVFCSVLHMSIYPVRTSVFSGISGTSGYLEQNALPELLSKKEFLGLISSYLGGWVAESVVLGTDMVSSASHQDIAVATEYAAECVRSFGFTDTPIAKTREAVANNYTITESAEDQKAIVSIINKQKKASQSTIVAHEKEILGLASLLLTKSYVSGKEIKEFIEDECGIVVEKPVLVQDIFEKKIAELQDNQ